MKKPPGGTGSLLFPFFNTVLCRGKCITSREQEAPPAFYHFHVKHVFLIIQLFAAELFTSLLAKNCSCLGSHSIYD